MMGISHKLSIKFVATTITVFHFNCPEASSRTIFCRQKGLILFLVACIPLYKPLSRPVGPLVRQSVGPSLGPSPFTFFSFLSNVEVNECGFQLLLSLQAHFEYVCIISYNFLSFFVIMISVIFHRFFHFCCFKPMK